MKPTKAGFRVSRVQHVFFHELTSPVSKASIFIRQGGLIMSLGSGLALYLHRLLRIPRFTVFMDYAHLVKSLSASLTATIKTKQMFLSKGWTFMASQKNAWDSAWNRPITGGFSGDTFYRSCWMVSFPAHQPWELSVKGSVLFLV